MSLENRHGQQSESVSVVYPPELTEDRKIHVGNVRRNAQRILSGLSNLGLQATQPAEIEITNLSAYKTKKLGQNNFQRTMSMRITTKDIPFSIGRPIGNSSDLVHDSSAQLSMTDNYSIDTCMHFDGQPFRIFLNVEPKRHQSHKLDLVMSTALQLNKGMLLESLTPNFTTIGFIHDLAHNPQHRDRLSAVAQKRIPSQVLEGIRGRRSSVIGHETPEGINAILDLYMQSPNSQDFLKCYEVELFSKDGKRNPENTTEIAPESVWQEKQRHFCMIGSADTSFPLIPLDIGRIARLAVRIQRKGASSDTASELLGDLPLSIDGTNQWYATGYLGDGSVELLFKPEWGEDNTRLVYRQKSKKRISPKEIHTAVVGLSTLKKTLTERLAA